MKNITINYTKKTIEITKSFEKKAREYGSDAYQTLRNLKNEFPKFELVVKAPKSSNTFKGMDYDFMEEYIKKQANADELMESFKKLRENEFSYGEIKQWFIGKFPVFKECKTRAEWFLAA
jgi:hypothetical protein